MRVKLKDSMSEPLILNDCVDFADFFRILLIGLISSIGKVW